MLLWPWAGGGTTQFSFDNAAGHFVRLILNKVWDKQPCRAVPTWDLDLAGVSSWRRLHEERRSRYVDAGVLDAHLVETDVLGRVLHCVRAVSVVLNLGSHKVSLWVLATKEGTCETQPFSVMFTNTPKKVKKITTSAELPHGTLALTWVGK